MDDERIDYSFLPLEEKNNRTSSQRRCPRNLIRVNFEQPIINGGLLRLIAGQAKKNDNKRA
jgi:hypothetical protein